MATANATQVAVVPLSSRFHSVAAVNRLCNVGFRDRICSVKSKKLSVSRSSTKSEKMAASYMVKEVTDEDLEKQVQPDDIRVLAAVKSRYNYISVMEVAQEADHLLAGARILLLDNPGCIHTVYYPQNVLTNSYYDALAAVVPLLPEEGPLGILGLGAGAVAHIVHHFFPTRIMHAWELDQDIVAIARKYFDLPQLEPALTVHVGDAVGDEVRVEGGFAGLIVDLFAEGRVIPALQQVATWEALKAKLKAGGRIIVNCGGDRVMAGGSESKSSGQIYMEETIATMRQVFGGGELSTRYLARKGFNTVAVTGPPPDVHVWTEALPQPLRDGINDWKQVVDPKP